MHGQEDNMLNPVSFLHGKIYKISGLRYAIPSSRQFPHGSIVKQIFSAESANNLCRGNRDSPDLSRKPTNFRFVSRFQMKKQEDYEGLIEFLKVVSRGLNPNFQLNRKI